MPDDSALTAVLTQLSGIANAPMTAEQRETRAAPVLTAAGVTTADIIESSKRADLPWNVSKAAAFGIPVETWMQGISVVCEPAPQTVGELLDCLHRADSAAAMLKAGYRPSRDTAGRLSWARE
jgi:hypothetical protein